ncbi:MAG TPA: zinc ribbon domain-containing protein, partial [Polyangiaceae bacterium]|nr:zinc ribbon domain-containing protein [Polyangiaceae bacterium]
MIICPKCTKENQDHYKFCLGCGAELPRDASPKKFAPTSNTPPQGVPKVQPPHAIADESTTQGVTGDGASAGGDAPPVICPQCSHPNPVSNKFCASWGFKLGKPASVPAPDAAGAAPAP